MTGKETNSLIAQHDLQILALIQVSTVYAAMHHGFGMVERLLSVSEIQSIMQVRQPEPEHHC